MFWVYHVNAFEIENVKTTSMEKASALVLGKNKHWLRRENKTSKKRGMITLQDIKVYVNIYA